MPRMPRPPKREPRYHVYEAVCDKCGLIYSSRNEMKVKVKAEEHRKKKGKGHFVWVLARPVY